MAIRDAVQSLGLQPSSTHGSGGVGGQGQEESKAARRITLDVLRAALLGSGGDESSYSTRGGSAGGERGGAEAHDDERDASAGGQEVDPLEALGIVGASAEDQQRQKGKGGKSGGAGGTKRDILQGGDGSSSDEDDEVTASHASHRHRRRHRSGPRVSVQPDHHADARSAEREALLLRAALKTETSAFMSGGLADDARGATLDILDVRADADIEEGDEGGTGGQDKSQAGADNDLAGQIQ